MTQFTKVNGDFQPVVVLDSGVANAAPGAGWNSGLNAVVSGATVQPQGPKLDYFTTTFDGSLTGAEIAQAFQTVQQLATVYIYEYTVASDDTLAVAIYPTAAWTATALDAAFDDAGIANTSTSTGAAFSG